MNKDVLTHTGNELSPDGAKSGDYVVEVHTRDGSEVRIVFECKKRKSLRVAEIRKELDAAVKNRDAAVAVMVLSSESTAPHHMPLCTLDDNRHVAVYDDVTRNALALRLAFQQARSDALATLSTPGVADGLDVDALVAKLAEAKDLLSQFGEIQKNLRSARRALDGLEKTAVSMNTQLLAYLNECDQLAKA